MVTNGREHRFLVFSVQYNSILGMEQWDLVSSHEREEDARKDVETTQDCRDILVILEGWVIRASR